METPGYEMPGIPATLHFRCGGEVALCLQVKLGLLHMAALWSSGDYIMSPGDWSLEL